VLKIAGFELGDFSMIKRAAPPPLHVDAAAHGTLLAVERGKAGVFNIAEDSGFVSIAKARRELGWDPRFCIQTERR